MKDLLRITYIGESLCKVESNIEDEDMGAELAAALLGAMVKSAAICAAVLSAADVFLDNPDEVTKLANRAIQFMPGNGQAS